MYFLINFLRRNFYLILAAGILITVSYIVNFYLGSNESIKSMRNSIESFMQERESDFEKIAKDSNLLMRLNLETYGGQELENMVSKKYGILLYEKKPDGLSTLKFWSDQQSVMPDSLLSRPDGNYFVRLSN